MRAQTREVGDVVVPTAPVQGHIKPMAPIGPSTRELAEEIVKLLRRKPRKGAR